MKQTILTRLAGMPIAIAASRWPPVAFIQLPKLVSDSIAAASSAIASEPDEGGAEAIRPGR